MGKWGYNPTCRSYSPFLHSRVVLVVVFLIPSLKAFLSGHVVRSNQVQSWWDIRDTFGTRFFGEHFPPSVATARMYQFELCVKGFDVSAMTSYYHKGYQRQDEGFYLGDLNWIVLKNGFSWKPPSKRRCDLTKWLGFSIISCWHSVVLKGRLFDSLNHIAQLKPPNQCYYFSGTFRTFGGI